ncbi:hypothetical protein ACHAWO_011731 [Cyclotella atomus]|jgi:peroxin-12|uniref:Peroxin-12 n=1 Tax=Cyclotella atomus TaxID=382360 RepID=A0ABD3MP56_9STRA
MNDGTNNTSHNATVPTTIGALLAEEITIDPLSHLPSFLELTFVDVARNSGRVALSAAWDVGILYLKGLEERLAQLERMLIYRVANLRARSSTGGGSNLDAIKRIVAAAVARLRLCYYTRLRRACYVIVKGLQMLTPELQSLVMFAIDYHCIHYLAGSTGCEMVYGLKRSKIVKMQTKKTDKKVAVQDEQRVLELSSADKTKSAVLAALLPYWKERCDKLYTSLTEHPTNQSSIVFHPDLKLQKLKDTFMKIYPYIHLTHEGSIFLYQFAYLLEYTPYWSFSLHGLGVVLRRITVADMKQRSDPQQQIHQQSSSKLPSANSQRAQRDVGRISTLNKNTARLTIPKLLRGALLFSASYTLVSGWYRYFQRQLSLRRRRWIAGENGAAQLAAGESTQHMIKHPIPPPPLPPVKLNTSVVLDKWACPLCHEARINPAASTSGYVFCYKCLILKLRQDGEHCPLTGMPCKERQVVRLYESTVPR